MTRSALSPRPDATDDVGTVSAAAPAAHGQHGHAHEHEHDHDHEHDHPAADGHGNAATACGHDHGHAPAAASTAHPAPASGDRRHDHGHTHDHSHDDGHAHSHAHDHQHEHDHSHGCTPCGGGHAASGAAAEDDGPLRPAEGHVVSRWRIDQMDCPAEANLIRSAMQNRSDVSGQQFNLVQRTLRLAHAPQATETLEQVLSGLGMQPQRLEDGSVAPPPKARPVGWLVLGGLTALAAEIAHFSSAPTWLVALLALVAVLAAGLDTYRKGWLALRHRQLNINALMSIAVTGALLIGEWPEAAMVMVLFAIAERIEAASLERARRAVSDLLKLEPAQAMVQAADGSWAPMAASAVPVGARVRAAPGERIALDGVVVQGESNVDQAPITGESLPVHRGPGDPVFAGTLNGTAALEYTTTALARDTTLARIVQAVEEAQATRAPAQRMVDRFAKIYTPAVVVVALLVALVGPLFFGLSWFEGIYQALVLLVIACPCALVISTPVAVVSGLTAAARQGILIKGGVYLEQGRRLRWLAVDKTGTITQGKPAQTDLLVLGGDATRLRQAALSLAAVSDHPVSQAIAAGQADLAALPVEGLRALPGMGVEGTVAGHHYQLGNLRLAGDTRRPDAALQARLEQWANTGNSVTLLLDDSGILAAFAVADTVRPTSRAAVAELQALGVEVVMLSGDNAGTARAVAEAVGITTALGEQLPADKHRAVQDAVARVNGTVGMVGDGINDAPALAAAHIGFAMGAAGSDTAIEAADVALMQDDLARLPTFVRLARATHRVLVQNVVIALGLKAVFLALALVGAATLWMAVFADVGASLIVVANSLRLLQRGRRPSSPETTA